MKSQLVMSHKVSLCYNRIKPTNAQYLVFISLCFYFNFNGKEQHKFYHYVVFVVVVIIVIFVIAASAAMLVLVNVLVLVLVVSKCCDSLWCVHKIEQNVKYSSDVNVNIYVLKLPGSIKYGTVS
jgi:hypothetical protein